MNEFEIYPVSALEKVRPDLRPLLYEEEKSVFGNERASFQIAMRSIGGELRDCRLEAEGEGDIRLFSIGFVPCSYPVKESGDDYLCDGAGRLVPDILRPCSGECVQFPANLWKSFFVTVKNLKRGSNLIKLSVFRGEEKMGSAVYRINVLPEMLPETDFKYSNWIHYDGISENHRLEMFSEEYFSVLGKYISCAEEHGINVLYVPLFTPPLDTDFDKERKTAQLVGVEISDGKYVFDFSLLRKFFRLAESCKIKYYEFSHLFSQWGARSCPKIIAKKDGVPVRIFGQDSDSLSAEYRYFLNAFLKELKKLIAELGIEKRCFFHISDEPSEANADRYAACRKIVKEAYPECVIIDAMTDENVLKRGLAEIPVVGTDRAEIFSGNTSSEWWAYYCTVQDKNFLSNRFLSMPLERTRIIGMQLYENGARGFLQWGYNFYNSFLSRYPIDPFVDTDAGEGFQSGDAFIVYPDTEGKGVFSSLRLEAMADAMYDYRALKLAEEKKGEIFVKNFLSENGLKNGFTDYVKNPLWLLRLRGKVNSLVGKR
mgnify:FL=1